MSRIIDVRLEDQATLLCRMGELTQETVELALRGYLKGTSVHPRIQEMSDTLIAMANEIEDKTFELIARYQPVASDLRTIKSNMKIAYDFARYGRYSLDISYINDRLNGLKECETWIRTHVMEMSEKVLSMVETSINALRKHDVELAKTISKTEQEVDGMYFNYLDRLAETVQVTNRCIISSLLVVRYLERIADHATYICESIVYIATGEKINLG